MYKIHASVVFHHVPTTLFHIFMIQSLVLQPVLDTR